MEERFENCEPTICGSDLLSKDDIHMTSDVIKNQCNCAKRAVCYEIVRLLSVGRYPEADNMIKQFT